MRAHTRLLVAALVAFPTVAAGQDAARRAMTTDDGLNLVRVTSPLLSPDGRWVFYGLDTLDWAKNKRGTTYYMAPADGGEPFQYVGEAGGSRFEFSPDGRYLSFTRPVEDKAQLFLMRTNGGEAVQLTRHETAVGSYRWAPDGSRIVFVADEPRSDDEEKARKAGDDAIFVDEGPNGQEDDQWNNLWAVDVSSREETRLTQEDFLIGSFDVAPDGRVVLTARYENRRNQGNLSEIYLHEPGVEGLRRLTDNRAPEGGVAWSPDGSRIAFTAPSIDEWDLRLPRVWLLGPEGGAPAAISDAFEGSIVSSLTWTEDGRELLFSGRQRTNTNVFALEVAGGRLRQLTGETGSLRAHGFSRDGTRMLYTFEDFDTPPDLYTSPTRQLEPTRITEANPWVATDLALGRGETVRWRSDDGTEIEGLLMVPGGYDRSQPLPLLLHIHGGPAGVFSNAFQPSYHVWAGLGYAQLMPNVRGSSGYTDELLRGNMRDIGGGDYLDLMTGVDHVIAQGIADPERLGVRGWSYGGILGGWTLTQTDRFKGASVGAMVSDWTSEYGPGFNHDVRLWYIGGTPWENPEGYRRRSALTHVANVTTPTLILHGINDRTDTEAQSMMFFTALKDQGKTVRYIRFPREPHGFREPHHQRIRDVEEIRWIQKYVRDIEWTPWERPLEADEDKPDVVSDGRP